jgi:hypothetical protein
LSSSSSLNSSSSSSLSSASSSISTLEITEILSGEETYTEIVPSGLNEDAIETEEEFNKVIDKYLTDLTDLGSVSEYFSDGQIILIYHGEVNSCKPQPVFNKTLGADDVSDISVKVVVGVSEQKDGGFECVPTITHPFSIYHIKTKKKLIFEEELQAE